MAPIGALAATGQSQLEVPYCPQVSIITQEPRSNKVLYGYLRSLGLKDLYRAQKT